MRRKLSLSVLFEENNAGWFPGKAAPELGH